jgi:DNA-binding FrmR family transcriptional regulator
MIKNEKTDQISDRKKDREENERRDLMNRLKRIEGQVRGLQRMIDEDAYCPDVLTQASAVNSAINSFCKVLLANHIRTCVANDIRAGRDETVDELVTTLQKLMK